MSYIRKLKKLENGSFATTLPGGLCESLSLMLTPSAQEIRSMLLELRSRYLISRPLLAAFLGTSRKTVVSWEKGLREPSGPAKRLIQMVYQRITSEMTGNCFIL